jgi:hypothetical protein
MGTDFQEVLCDEHRIGGEGNYCGGNNDAHLGRIIVLYYEAGRNLVNHTRGQKWAKGHYKRVDTNSSDPPTTKGLSTYSSAHPLPPRPLV